MAGHVKMFSLFLGLGKPNAPILFITLGLTFPLSCVWNPPFSFDKVVRVVDGASKSEQWTRQSNGENPPSSFYKPHWLPQKAYKLIILTNWSDREMYYYYSN